MALEYAWSEISPSDQKEACIAYRVYPDEAFAAFDEGSDGVFSESVFNEFFTDQCYGSITY